MGVDTGILQVSGVNPFFSLWERWRGLETRIVRS